MILQVNNDVLPEPLISADMIGIFLLFTVGAIVGYALARMTETSYERLKKLEKKHLDVLNWLRSELSEAKGRKLTKIVDKPRIIFLEKLIKKLKK